MTATQDQVGAFVLEKAEELRTLLARRCTSEIAWHCFRILQKPPREASREFGLWSPYRDSMYVLGLATTTPEPPRRDAGTPEEWNRIYKLVAEITSAYLPLFMKPPAVVRAMSREEHAKHAVAAFAFLHHFNTGVLATSEQLVARARASLVPFDDELSKIVGISATDVLLIAEWLAARTQRRIDDWLSAWTTADQLWRRSTNEGWSEARSQREAAAVSAKDPQFVRKLHCDPLVVERPAIEAEFGAERSVAFWKLFVTPRGSGEDFRFYTEANPLQRAPLVAFNDHEAMLPVANAVFDAVVNRLDGVLEASARRASFLKRRDKALEQRTEAALRRLLGTEAEFFPSASEWKTGEYEHDLVVLWRDVLLVVEAKAAPRVEPFRDVSRAYDRVRRAFRSDTGIQKAHSQGARLLRLLRHGQTVSLYDADGVLVREVAPDAIARAFAVCVTADDFGALAADLSLLLEKDPSDPYPWAVNINDLEQFAEGLAMKHWGPVEFFAYLEQRQLLHGHVTVGDELELAGMFLRHGRLGQPPPGGRLIVHPEYADIFDEIFKAKHGGPPADLSTNPDLVLRPESDARSAIRRVFGFDPAEISKSTSSSRVGRNDPCPCGSGRKFKKCHG